MATTALQGLPYPVGSDTPAGHTQLLTLANAIEKQVVMVFASAAARTSALTTASVTATEGMLCWLQDINRYEYYTGSAWHPLTSYELGHAEITSNPTGTTSATLADISGLSVTANVLVGRLYEVKFRCRGVQSTSGTTDVCNLALTAAGTVVDDGFWLCSGTGSARWHPVLFARDAPAASASRTWTVQMARVAGGAGTVTIGTASTAPAQLTVRDIGPA